MFDVVPKSLHVNPPKAWPGRGFVGPWVRGFLPLLSLLFFVALLGGGLGGGCPDGAGTGGAGVSGGSTCKGGNQVPQNAAEAGGGGSGMGPLRLRRFSTKITFRPFHPRDDVSSANPANRLVIRMQREGTRIEVNDILFVDVRNVQQVGRCVRGLDPISGLPDKSNKQGVV